jgi:hypothetical protein
MLENPSAMMFDDMPSEQNLHLVQGFRIMFDCQRVFVQHQSNCLFLNVLINVKKLYMLGEIIAKHN